jgi:hypothetical protein
LKYDIYRNAWPLLAFATYRKILERADIRRNDEVKVFGSSVVHAK